MLSGLKEKLSTAEAEIGGRQGRPRRQQPEDVGPTGEYGGASQADERRDRAECAQHLKERIGTGANPDRVTRGRASSKRRRSLIDIQAQRDRLGQLQRDVEFRAEQLNARERAAEQAKLKSKLTFSDMTVLDKAFPPVEPAFPKPFVVMPVGIAAGLGARADPGASRRSGGSAGSLSSRSGICGAGPVLGLYRQRGTREGANWRIAPRPSTRLSSIGRGDVLTVGFGRAAGQPKDLERFGKELGGNVFCGPRCARRVDSSNN